MVRPGRDLLIGPVEVDESYIGAPEQDVHGRAPSDKTIIAIAAERRGRATGRIRIETIADCSSETLLPFVTNHVAAGAVVRTDGWFAYKGLQRLNFQHEVVKIRGAGRPAHELLPHVHRVASLLKRWLMGTHQGGVQSQHIGYYLDEFTFRFNRRTSRSRGLLFFRLMEQAVLTPPAPYKSLIGGRNVVDHNIL